MANPGSTRVCSAAATLTIAAAAGIEQLDIPARRVWLTLDWLLVLFDELAALPVPAVVKLHRWLQESARYAHRSPDVLACFISPELQDDRFAGERELVSAIERAIVDLIETAQAEGDVRTVNPASAARMIQAMFDALAFPGMEVGPDKIVRLAMTALVSDADRLAEIRSAADALGIVVARRKIV